MNYRPICKRFVQAFIATFVLLFVVYATRGQSAASAAADAVLWSVISAGVFSAAVMRNIRRKSTCAICQQ